MLCLTLTGRSMDENMDILSRNRKSVSLAELRLDCLNMADGELEKAASFEKDCRLPVILTCRRRSDGGKFDGTEKQRLHLMREVLSGGFSYIDLETDVMDSALLELAASGGTRVIRSFHDFNGIPADISSRIRDIQSKGEIPKAAVMMNGIRDLIRLFRIREESPGDEMIIVGMGQYGIPSRILYRKVGSMLMFCCEEDKGNTGILSPSVMMDMYHANSIDSTTEVFGIIGNPVFHSQSPSLHNQGFRRIGLNAVYVPFLVDDTSSFLTLAEILSIRGFSVTIPHKVSMIPLLDEVGEEVIRVGSCNTVVRKGSGWHGSNTDYLGFLSILDEDFRKHAIRKAIVIGAGGAARAIVHALREMNVDVTILNRNRDHARELGEITASSYDGLENASTYSGTADLIVQATSVGMGDEDADPVPDLMFNGHEILFDIVYTPDETAIIRRACSCGCRIIYGKELLIAQGHLQFKSFTGFEYPI